MALKIQSFMSQFREQHKKCFVWEYREGDERRGNEDKHPFSISGERKVLNATIFGSKKIIEKIVKDNNGVYNEPNEAFKNKEDAQKVVDLINDFNFLIETVTEQYFLNEDFKEKFDDLMSPYVILKKLE